MSWNGFSLKGIFGLGRRGKQGNKQAGRQGKITAARGQHASRCPSPNGNLYDADFFFVIQGSAKLLTGGTVQDGKTVSPGEIRGKSVLNGVETTLNPGDIVHIPATVPHQLLLPEGQSFLYFVIKVKEK